MSKASQGCWSSSYDMQWATAEERSLKWDEQTSGFSHELGGIRWIFCTGGAPRALRSTEDDQMREGVDLLLMEGRGASGVGPWDHSRGDRSLYPNW